MHGRPLRFQTGSQGADACLLQCSLSLTAARIRRYESLHPSGGSHLAAVEGRDGYALLTSGDLVFCSFAYRPP